MKVIALLVKKCLGDGRAAGECSTYGSRRSNRAPTAVSSDVGGPEMLDGVWPGKVVRERRDPSEMAEDRAFAPALFVARTRSCCFHATVNDDQSSQDDPDDDQ